MVQYYGKKHKVWGIWYKASGKSKKEKGDPDDVLNCYPYADASLNNEALIRLMTVQSKDKEDWIEPSVKLIKMPLDFLKENSIHDEFSSGLNNWVTDYKQSEIINIDNKKALCVKSIIDSDGYAMINFPYGQKGKIEIRYQIDIGFKEAQLILSDNYIDQSSFKADEETSQYIKYIEENYISINFTKDELSKDADIIGNDLTGNLDIDWDCIQRKIILNCNGVSKEVNVPPTFEGFNYAGFILPKGIKQRFIIKDFKEVSEKPWLETGIEY